MPAASPRVCGGRLIPASAPLARRCLELAAPQVALSTAIATVPPSDLKQLVRDFAPVFLLAGLLMGCHRRIHSFRRLLFCLKATAVGSVVARDTSAFQLALLCAPRAIDHT